MPQEAPYPLFFWEQTNQPQNQRAQAQQQLAFLRGRFPDGFYVSSDQFQFTSNCLPVVFGRPKHVLSPKPGLTADQALSRAKTSGSSGYFRVEDLEKFIDGRGFIIDMAMSDQDFRPHLRDPEKWAKRSRSEAPGRSSLWQILHGHETDLLAFDEAKRLKDLLTSPPVLSEPGRTYSIVANRLGMVYIALQANPFTGLTAETLSELSQQLRQKVHLAPVQDGFTLSARNIAFSFPRSDLGLDYDGVHLQASRDGRLIGEAVWPARVEKADLSTLALDLVNKVN